MIEFDRFEDAEKELDKSNTKRVNKIFCPLLKDWCREDCESYIQPGLREVLKAPRMVFKVTPAYCNSPMLNPISE